MHSYVRLISEDTVLFSYEDTSLSHYDVFPHKLGDIILNLLDLKIETVKSKYSQLLNDLISPSIEADDASLKSIRLRFNELDEEYPALWFHTHLLYYCFGGVFYTDTFTVNNDLLSLKNARRMFDGSRYSCIAFVISVFQ